MSESSEKLKKFIKRLKKRLDWPKNSLKNSKPAEKSQKVPRKIIIMTEKGRDLENYNPHDNFRVKRTLKCSWLNFEMVLFGL